MTLYQNNFLTRNIAISCQTGGIVKQYSIFSDGVGFEVYSKDVNLSIAKAKVRLNIFSDSQTAMKSLDSVFLNSKTIIKCCRYLNEIFEKFKIHLILVPGQGAVVQMSIQCQGQPCKFQDILNLLVSLQHPINLYCGNKAINDTNNRWSLIWNCEHVRNTFPSICYAFLYWKLREEVPVLIDIVELVTETFAGSVKEFVLTSLSPPEALTAVGSLSIPMWSIESSITVISTSS